jgi:hypothetical protein
MDDRQIDFSRKNRVLWFFVDTDDRYSKRIWPKTGLTVTDVRYNRPRLPAVTSYHVQSPAIAGNCLSAWQRPIAVVQAEPQ